MTDTTSTVAGWQVERNASEAYERYLVPAIFESWTKRLVETVDIRDNHDVLDVGCGTGIVARRAAAEVGEGAVFGIDINERMLEVAQASANEEGHGITWDQADVSDLPFEDDRFDIVLCQQAIQFFATPEAALAELQRVLSPGGQGALSVWRPIAHQPGYGILADALDQRIGADAGAVMRSPFPDWGGEQLRTLANSAGCIDPTVTIEIGSMRYPSVHEFVRREAAASPLSESIASIDSATRDEVVRAVRRNLESYTDDHGVTTPMESYVLTWGG